MEFKHVIWLVAGTTEGRKIAEFFAQRNDVLCYVSVATAYGAELLPRKENIKILAERMDEQAMLKFLKEQKPELVLDATHPYATIVTETLRKACETVPCEYWRVVREQGTYKDSITVADFTEAVELLSHTKGNIFLTTGSKNLPDFMQIPDYQNRIAVRILPMADSLQKAMSCGYKPANIVCMQGPFSKELDVAMFKHYQAKYVVTKDSGKVGGFPGKEAAAKEIGAKLLIITRNAETGSSYLDVINKLQARLGGKGV